MAKGYRPVKGSRAFWPKKRAKRIYPRINTAIRAGESLPLAFMGYKAGMTRTVLLDTKKESPTENMEVSKPVTVIETPSMVVCGIKAYKRTHDGLQEVMFTWNDKLSKDLKRKTSVPKEPRKDIGKIEKNLESIDEIRLLVHTKPRDTAFSKKTPELIELIIGGDKNAQFKYAKDRLGGEIRAEEIFKEGEYIDVKAITKGKGYQGPVKRFGVKVRNRKAANKRRHIGCLGARSIARILPGKIAMAGQLGYQARTEYNKRIVKIGNGELSPKGGWVNYGLVNGDYIIVEGSVPGPKKRAVIIRKGVRAHPQQAMEVKGIVLDSQQGLRPRN